jgi:hypothetical protein
MAVFSGQGSKELCRKIRTRNNLSELSLSAPSGRTRGSAAWCVAGVLAGILLRVRAFLFLGVAFLVLVIFTQIWHAAVDLAQTWVWWACGAALGAAILTLFGLFEKRRNDMLRVVEEIRGWQ